MAALVDQKWSEQFICNKTFFGNILKESFNAFSP